IMTNRVNFKLDYNGQTHRFASTLRDDELFLAFNAKVDSIVDEDVFDLFWKDDDSQIVLETADDLAAAIDYAMVTRKRETKPPCVNLVVEIRTLTAATAAQRIKPAAAAAPSGVEAAVAALRLEPVASAAEPNPNAEKLLRLSPAQEAAMEKTFARTHYPDFVARIELTEKLSLTENQVQQWFENRRAVLNKKLEMRLNEEEQKKKVAGSLTDAEERDVCRLMDIGFEREAAIQALAETASVTEAMHLLLNESTLQQYTDRINFEIQMQQSEDQKRSAMRELEKSRIITPKKKAVLEEKFSQNPYQGGIARLELAAKLGLTEKQVKTWFQNRRIKEKPQSEAPIEVPTAIRFGGIVHRGVPPYPAENDAPSATRFGGIVRAGPPYYEMNTVPPASRFVGIVPAAPPAAKEIPIVDRLVGPVTPANPVEVMPTRRQFFEKLVDFCERHGEPITMIPQVSKQNVDLHRLYIAVRNKGGFEQVTKDKGWKTICSEANPDIIESSAAGYQMRRHFQKHLLLLECMETGKNADDAVACADKLKKKTAPSAAAAAAASGETGEANKKEAPGGIIGPDVAAVLEKTFDKCYYPDIGTRTALANKLHLSEAQVQVWFSHRRHEMREAKKLRRPKEKAEELVKEYTNLDDIETRRQQLEKLVIGGQHHAPAFDQFHARCKTDFAQLEELFKTLKETKENNPTPVEKEDGRFDVFLSYRRVTDVDLASAICTLLRLRGFKVFMGEETWVGGKSNSLLLEKMMVSKHVIVVLTPNSLHGLHGDHNMLSELRLAFLHKKNIIPILDRQFEFPAEDSFSVPMDIRPLTKIEGVWWVHDSQETCMDEVQRRINGDNIRQLDKDLDKLRMVEVEQKKEERSLSDKEALEVSRMMDMGFEMDVCIKALDKTGNVEDATEMLLNQRPASPAVPAPFEFAPAAYGTKAQMKAHEKALLDVLRSEAEHNIAQIEKLLQAAPEQEMPLVPRPSLTEPASFQSFEQLCKAADRTVDGLARDSAAAISKMNRIATGTKIGRFTIPAPIPPPPPFIMPSALPPHMIAPAAESFVAPPAHSYSSLIKMALKSSDKEMMSLNQICEWIMEKFLYYRQSQSKAWQSTVSLSLMQKDCFVKVTPSVGEQCYWKMAVKDENQSIPRMYPDISNEEKRLAMLANDAATFKVDVVSAIAAEPLQQHSVVDAAAPAPLRITLGNLDFENDPNDPEKWRIVGTNETLEGYEQEWEQEWEDVEEEEEEKGEQEDDESVDEESEEESYDAYSDEEEEEIEDDEESYDGYSEEVEDEEKVEEGDEEKKEEEVKGYDPALPLQSNTPTEPQAVQEVIIPAVQPVQPVVTPLIWIPVQQPTILTLQQVQQVDTPTVSKPAQSVKNEESTANKERELKIREKALQIKEEAFERRVAEFAVMMDDFEEKMKKLNDRVEKIEKSKKEETLKTRMEKMEERLVKVEERIDENETVVM
ncbi:hypothetical protein PENTCL1PPCAC_1460, partial [Pristionchus entomophagus]